MYSFFNTDMPPKTEYWNHDQSVANPATAINPLFDDHSELNLETIALANQLHPQQTDASLFNPAFSSTTNIPQAHGQSGYQYNNDIHDEFYFEGGANISPPPQPYTNDSETFQTYPRSSSESSPNGLNISPGASEAASTFNGDTKPTNGNMFVPSSLSTSPQMSVPGPYRQNSLTDATSSYRQNSLSESIQGGIGPRLSSRQNSITEVAGITKPSKRGSSQRSKRQMLDEQDAILIARDDSELTEEELQLKRKAQNRAAQRAFRERKETKLKELEAKLLQSEEERQKSMDQLEIIRKQNISITTENEILRSSGDIHSGGAFPSRHPHITPVNKFNFPKTQDDFIKHVLRGTDHKLKEENKNKVYADNDGCKLLALGAVWDYLQIKAEEADLDFNSIDFSDVMERLKGAERCHGYGPAYPLDLVNQAIESSLN